MRENVYMALQAQEITVVGDEVTAWRLHELLAAGYEWDDALKLALRRGVDLRVAAQLLRNGCPSALALRILL